MYPRIRGLREDLDMNQTKMAQELGMSQTGYSKYETGENDIPTTVLIKLTMFHNCSVDYLLGLTIILREHDENLEKYITIICFFNGNINSFVKKMKSILKC